MVYERSVATRGFMETYHLFHVSVLVVIKKINCHTLDALLNNE